MKKIVALFTALIATFALASPASAHWYGTVQEGPGNTPAVAREVYDLLSWRMNGEAGSFFQSQTQAKSTYHGPTGAHYTSSKHEYYLDPAPGRTVQIRTRTYCVEDGNGTQVAWLIDNGTQHGPAGGDGQFQPSDPTIWSSQPEFQHCRVFQSNTEMIERNASNGAQTGYQLRIVKMRAWG